MSGALPAIAADPRDSQTCRLCALGGVRVAVANVRHVMRLKPQAFQCFLEHKSIRFVGSHGFGDEDELNWQCDVPGSAVLMIGIGNNGGAHAPERVQHLERCRQSSSVPVTPKK